MDVHRDANAPRVREDLTALVEKLPDANFARRAPRPFRLLEGKGGQLIALLIAVAAGSNTADAQDVFDLHFDHSTVLVSDLDRSAAFYEDILHLQALETPWGPAAPIRFYSLGGGRQLHVGLSEGRTAPDKNIHLAFAVQNFDAYLQFLSERGVGFANFPGSSSDPQVRPDGVRQIYLQDPDGNWIEINDAAHPPG
jgi:lactoylglutathione lyase